MILPVVAAFAKAAAVAAGSQLGSSLMGGLLGGGQQQQQGGGGLPQLNRKRHLQTIRNPSGGAYSKKAFDPVKDFLSGFQEDLVMRSFMGM